MGPSEDLSRGASFPGSNVSPQQMKGVQMPQVLQEQAPQQMQQQQPRSQEYRSQRAPEPTQYRSSPSLSNQEIQSLFQKFYKTLQKHDTEIEDLKATSQGLSALEIAMISLVCAFAVIIVILSIFLSRKSGGISGVMTTPPLGQSF